MRPLSAASTVRAVLLFVALIPSPAAQEAGPRAPPAEWFVFPVIFYAPETRLGLGATGGVHFVVRPGAETSDATVFAAYTLEDQSIMNVMARVFPLEGFDVGVGIGAANYPDRYYGIGPDTPASAREAYTSRRLDISLAPEWALVPRRLRAGVGLRYLNERIVDVAPGGALASGAVKGAEGSESLGVGPTLNWDSRDNRFAPSRGTFVEGWYLYVPRGSSTFGRARLDARMFVPLGARTVLGTDLLLELAHGEVPFTVLPQLALRGYYLGRWRDLASCTLQSEVRFGIWRWLGGAAFAGIAGVAPDLGSFSVQTIRPAAGVGARFRLTKDGLHLRLDAGFGQEGGNVYFSLGEAF